jgi:hypothetical protein
MDADGISGRIMQNLSNQSQKLIKMKEKTKSIFADLGVGNNLLNRFALNSRKKKFIKYGLYALLLFCLTIVIFNIL